MLEEILRRIDARLKVVGLADFAASKLAGLNEDAIRNIRRAVKEGGRQGISTATLVALAPVLKTSAGWLLSGDEPSPTDVPVLGTAAGSLADAFVIAGLVERVRRPPGLTQAEDVYAIFVRRASMVPEHPPGQLRFVSPHRPYVAGDSVIVRVRDHPEAEEHAFIARFIEETARKVVVRKLQPTANVEFERRFVVSVEKVLTTNELFGV